MISTFSLTGCADFALLTVQALYPKLDSKPYLAPCKRCRMIAAIAEGHFGPHHPWTKTIRQNYLDCQQAMQAVDDSE